MEIRDIPMAAMSLAVAVIVVTVMSLIIMGVQNQAPDNSASFGNQSLTWAGNNTEMAFSEGRVSTGSVKLYNDGTLVNQGNNYTVTASGITITNVSPTSDPEWITSELNVSYDYSFGSAAYNATGDGLGANQTFSSFFPLVALVLVGAIIVAIVVRFFTTRREE